MARSTALADPGGNPSAVGEAGKAIALAVVLSAAAAYVPLASIVFVFLLPLPVAYVTRRHGGRTGVSAALGTGFLAGLLTGPVNGLAAFCLAGVVGVVLGVGLRREWGFSRVLLSTTAATAIALVALLGASWVVTGLSVAEVESVIDESFASARELYISAGMDPETVTAAEDQARELLSAVPYVAPSLFALLGLVYAAVAGALAALIFPRMGEESAARLSFSRFRLHWAMAYGFIAGFGLLVVAGWTGPFAGWARLVGLNLFLFFQALYFVQGLALARWVDRSRGFGGLGKMVLYGGAVLSQAFFMLTSWVGLLDTWFDYRRRFPLPAAEGGPGAAGGADQEE